MADYDYTVKIIFLGDYLVNKTRILQALSTLKAEPEVRVLGKTNGMVDMVFARGEKRIRAKIIDTAGQERFRSITTSFYRGVQGCLLLFDVTQRSTFDSLDGWQKELSSHTPTDDVMMTVAGCTDHVTGSRERQVAKLKGQQFAENLNAPYREVSVKNVSTIVQALGDIIDRIIHKAITLPELSEAIMPMEQRRQSMQEQQQTRKSMCLC